MSKAKVLLKPLLEALVKLRATKAIRETHPDGKLGMPPAPRSTPSSMPLLPSS